MYNSFLVFDFGSNEEAAQHARHKLEGWKQAFRLDKKLLYKFDRGPDGGASEPASEQEPAKPAKTEKPKAAAKGKGSGKSKDAAPMSAKAPTATPTQAKLIVRLYFSGHEKMSHQRWIERIPAEEPFKAASPKVLKTGDPGFEDITSQFDALD